MPDGLPLVRAIAWLPPAGPQQRDSPCLDQSAHFVGRSDDRGYWYALSVRSQAQFPSVWIRPGLALRNMRPAAFRLDHREAMRQPFWHTCPAVEMLHFCSMRLSWAGINYP